MKKILASMPLILACMASSAVAEVGSATRSDHRSFNKGTDILIAQFDNKPDPDDIHSQAALGCMLKHPDFEGLNVYGVQGAYGKQTGVFLDSSGLFNLIYGPEGENTWTDAHVDRSLSITRIVKKVKPILQAGGHVWVAEAGQSDVTAKWIAALIADGIPVATTKSKITVVQHSVYNERQSSAGVLDFLKANTTYVKIEDGNYEGNGTPGYNTEEDKHLHSVRQGLAKPGATAMWLLAVHIIQSGSEIATYTNIPILCDGLDYSDSVECWWILGLGSTADTVEKFWDRYVLQPVDYTALKFQTKTDAMLNSAVASEAALISGLSSPSAISVSGGQYAISSDGGTSFGAWTNARGTIANGHKVKVRLTSSAALGSTTSATLKIAGVDKLFSVMTTATRPKIYNEVGGLVVMEAENTLSPLGAPTDPNRWQLVAEGQPNYVSGATNGKHIEFQGNGPNGGKARTPLTYHFKINEGGYYRIILRCRKRLAGQPADKNNDCFVRVTGDEYEAGPNPGYKHMTDAPLNLLTKDTKLFGGNADDWGWSLELDAGGMKNKRNAVYKFKAGGTYTLTMSGRSINFNVDRIIFYRESVPEATYQAGAMPESGLVVDQNYM